LACKPITDQQLRVYMTDLQKHSQRTAAARAGFSERTAPHFDFGLRCRPDTALKAQDRSWAHGERSSRTLLGERPSPSFGNGQRAASRHPVAPPSKRASTGVPRRPYSAHFGTAGAPVAGAEWSRALHHLPPDAGAGIHRPIRLHPCRRAGRDDCRPAVPAPALSLRHGLYSKTQKRPSVPSGSSKKLNTVK